jgi:ParB family chromosome partitioning protein
MKEIKFQEIPVNNIEIPHHREREPEKFTDLINNIKKQGLIHPIRVRKEPDGKFSLIYGEGRLTAAKELGWMLIPAQVVEGVDDQTVLLQWLTENLQRVDMSPKDKAINIARLVDEFHYTIADVADDLGLSEKYVRKLYTVMKDGSEQLKESLDKKMVSVAGDIAQKFKNKTIHDELLHVFKKENVNKQKHQQVLIKSVDKKTESVRESIEKIRKELKQYRDMVNIAQSRREALVPNLEKLKKDSIFLNKLKIYRISLKW